MNRVAQLSLGIVMSAMALGQSTAMTLTPAKPIDIRVVEAQWHPSGQAIIYRRAVDDAFGLGIYTQTSKEGKVVIPLKKEDSYETTWLANSRAALVIVRSAAPSQKEKSTTLTIYHLDGDTQKATKIFGETYVNKFLPGVQIDPSPSLKHAILTFRSSTGSFHKVLTLGSVVLSDSPDLDRAEKEGNSGPNWSLDGTAIYSNAPNNGVRVLSDVLTAVKGNDGSQTVSGDSISGTFSISLSGDSSLNGNTISSIREFTFRLMPPMPATGANVLELMPANPILRPIRFRGPWVNPTQDGPNLVPKTQSIFLKFDQSNAQDTSVWLAQGNEKGAPAVLVAVHVTDTWLAQSKNSVAYTIDGALFFRSIN
ncbi:MAG: hypothetical protein WCG75_09175 [Armatimonadota bacterium]